MYVGIQIMPFHGNREGAKGMYSLMIETYFWTLINVIITIPFPTKKYMLIYVVYFMMSHEDEQQIY